MMIYILIPIFIFWVFTAVKNILFWAYLWQLKEYRYDRMKAHFELPSSHNILINQRLTITFVLLILNSIGVIIGVSALEWVFASITLLYYAFLALHTMRQFKNRKLVLPLFTSRILLIIIVSILAHAAVLILILHLVHDKWILQGKLALDFFSPFICYLGVFISNPLVNAYKKKIFKKASEKRTSLDGVLTIGITGSYGKTSTKEFLATILSEKFSVLKTESNNNTDIGVANTILHKLDSSYDIFVAEMGAYKIGEIAKTAAMVKPSIGVLTGLGPQHLSLFGGMQNTQKAKYELIESLPEKGLAIFNGDNDGVRSLFRKCTKPKRLYTSDRLLDFSNIAGIQAESMRYTNEGMEIKVHDENNNNEVITTSLLGKHNATNLLGAITVARSVGMSFDEIRRGVRKLKPLSHTLQPMQGINHTVVVDDSYSGNMHGVFAALEVLSRMKGNKKILVLQPLIELGEVASKVHRDIGIKIGEICDYCVVTSKDYYSLLYQEATKNGMRKDAMFCIENPKNAFEKIEQITNKRDIILVENRINKELFDMLVMNVDTGSKNQHTEDNDKDHANDADKSEDTDKSTDADTTQETPDAPENKEKSEHSNTSNE